ncbi:hypothetical protein LCGC14_3021050, partial [marine sediment metagenome]
KAQARSLWRRHVDAKDWETQSVRSDLKASIAEEISSHTKIREEVVAEFISSWATSSSDHNAWSLSLQMAAARLFGIESTPFVEESWAQVSPDPSYRDDKYGEEHNKKAKEGMIMDATQILRHVYSRTQEWLKERGITKVPLGRGQNWHGDEVPPELGNIDLSDEDWEVLYNMRLNQYTRKERAALARAESQYRLRLRPHARTDRRHRCNYVV